MKGQKPWENKLQDNVGHLTKFMARRSGKFQMNLTSCAPELMVNQEIFPLGCLRLTLVAKNHKNCIIAKLPATVSILKGYFNSHFQFLLFLCAWWFLHFLIFVPLAFTLFHERSQIRALKFLHTYSQLVRAPQDIKIYLYGERSFFQSIPLFLRSGGQGSLSKSTAFQGMGVPTP